MIHKLRKRFRLSALRILYFDYWLNANRKYSGKIALIIGVFNLTLLIPDFISIHSMPKILAILSFRVFLSALLFMLCTIVDKIKTFRSFFRILTAFELLAIVEFLFVLNQYDLPNFMIQAMGLLIINIAVFLVPNRWFYMLFISIGGTSGFFICSLLTIKNLDFMEFWACVVYLFLAILLCALFAYNADKHQFREFTAKEDLVYLNSTDPLTKAWNRNKLLNEFNAWQNDFNQLDSPISLALLDLDKFKDINDTYGHFLADTLLVDLVKLINNHLRGTDILVRWGGDEFVLLLPNTDLKNAADILERIRQVIEESSFSNAMNVTCSFGVVESYENSNLDAMIDSADHFMYVAKNRGGNCVLFRS